MDNDHRPETYMNTTQARHLADYLETLATYHPDFTCSQNPNHIFYMANFLTAIDPPRNCATIGCIAGSCWVMNGSPTLPSQSLRRHPDNDDINTYAANSLGLTDEQANMLFTPSATWLPEGGYQAITSSIAAKILREAISQYEKHGDFDTSIWDKAHDNS